MNECKINCTLLQPSPPKAHKNTIAAHTAVAATIDNTTTIDISDEDEYGQRNTKEVYNEKNSMSFDNYGHKQKSKDTHEKHSHFDDYSERRMSSQRSQIHSDTGDIDEHDGSIDVPTSKPKKIKDKSGHKKDKKDKDGSGIGKIKKKKDKKDKSKNKSEKRALKERSAAKKEKREKKKKKLAAAMAASGSNDAAVFDDAGSSYGNNLFDADGASANTTSDGMHSELSTIPKLTLKLGPSASSRPATPDIPPRKMYAF